MPGCDAKYQPAAGTQTRIGRESRAQTDPHDVWTPGFPRSTTRSLLRRAVAGARAPPSFTTGQWRRERSTAQLQRRPMATQEGQRPAPRWANSSVPRRPGRPSQGKEAGGRPLAPPRSPLTRCLVSLSSCSKPRARAGGCCASGPAPRSPLPAPWPLRTARTWRPRRTPSATRGVTSCASG